MYSQYEVSLFHEWLQLHWLSVSTCTQLDRYSGYACGLDGRRFESQWPNGLRRGSAADLLRGLRVRIQPGAWMFVLCVLYSKGQKAKARIIWTKKYG
jgi:hypothetical protein